MANEQNMLSVKIWRGGPKGGALVAYEVPKQASQTILDVVAWVQQNVEPSLSYRYACRVGMCGSCAMMVNGEPRWTCRTHVDKVAKAGHLEIAPLRNLTVIKDLAADLDPFFDKWGEADAVFHASSTRHDPIEPIDPTSVAREEASKGIECINCAVCYASCDTVTNNPDYLGPAALLRAWTLYNDAKDGDQTAIVEAVSKSGGCHTCHSHGNCTHYCPNELDPMTAIAGLKRASVSSFFKRGRD